MSAFGAGAEVLLIVLGVLAGLGVLVLGVLELVWPSRSRRRRRGVSRPRGDGELDGMPAGAEDGAPDPAAGVRGTDAETATLRACRDLYRRDRYAEAVATALQALDAGPPGRPAVTAALWSYVGLSRQGLGDFEAARTAFETAIAAVPEFSRAPYRRYLVALTVAAARSGRLRATTTTDLEERARRLQSALGWARRGLDVAPGDPSLQHVADEVRAALGAAWEAVGEALLARGDLTAARRLLNEALGDADVPAGRREALRALLARATPPPEEDEPGG